MLEEILIFLEGSLSFGNEKKKEKEKEKEREKLERPWRRQG